MPALATALRDRPRSILVVDDCEAVVAVVRMVLRQLGFEDVAEASDGEAALARLRERPVDLVISDWSMPRMSGFDLLRAVRSDERLKAIPFVMMTTPAQAEKFLWAKEAGADNCILKPFTPRALHAKLTAICSL